MISFEQEHYYLGDFLDDVVNIRYFSEGTKKLGNKNQLNFFMLLLFIDVFNTKIKMTKLEL